MHIVGPQLNCQQTCQAILRSLPDWFGIESAIVQYVIDIETLPTFLALNDDDDAIGFMTLRLHSPQAAELHVLAVRAEHHRLGVGRDLLLRVEDWLRTQHVQFLQVKTLSPTRDCVHYERTRRFYDAMGFVHLEEFPTLWGPRNPCLMMIKAL